MNGEWVFTAACVVGAGLAIALPVRSGAARYVKGSAGSAGPDGSDWSGGPAGSPPPGGLAGRWSGLVAGVRAGLVWRRWCARLRGTVQRGLRSSRRTVVLVTGGVAGLVCLPVAGWVAAVVVGTYAGLALRGLRRRERAREAARVRADGLDALSTLAAELRAGLPPLAIGAAVTGRLGELAGAAFRLAEETGAPLADLLERIEADARAVDRARTAATGEAAGARATAVLLAALPLGGVALGYALGVDPLHVLLRTPIGAACACAALLLQVAGLLWADRLTNAAGRPA